ncbi:HU family DNA-binding protein [Nostoc flagelliforme FACHB-838]|uniref:HU family DNA-binding protein n=1 Tax=Nostoc flagelliforme FACHB-838 TaxID=2692904 RepID=A0ABR8E1Q3_9NOSO|nr:HU family DNA-binding protein [Nostoc flagelliforme FACHB-838]
MCLVAVASSIIIFCSISAINYPHERLPKGSDGKVNFLFKIRLQGIGFGSFERRDRSSREGRNPKTKIHITVMI